MERPQRFHLTCGTLKFLKEVTTYHLLQEHAVGIYRAYSQSLQYQELMYVDMVILERLRRTYEKLNPIKYSL